MFIFITHTAPSGKTLIREFDSGRIDQEFLAAWFAEQSAEVIFFAEVSSD